MIDRRNGRLAGHVLAWSERKQVAYICPMDVLLLDIAETLEATEVRLPGGEAIIRLREGAAIAAAIAASTVSRWDYVDTSKQQVEEVGEEKAAGKEQTSQSQLEMSAPRRSPPPPPPPPKDDPYDAASVRAIAADMEKVHIPSSEIEVSSR